MICLDKISVLASILWLVWLDATCSIKKDFDAAPNIFVYKNGKRRLTLSCPVHDSFI